jgi:hypothetical protein
MFRTRLMRALTRCPGSKSSRRYLTTPISYARVRNEDEKTKAFRSKILSLVQVVTDERESADIVEKMLYDRDPIAVDMEGVGDSPVGLVQIRTREGQIYLFRTGINRSLYDKGKLKRLFETKDVLKVFHASTCDCLGIYADGVKMWGIYDTAIAHNVMRHQNEGRPVVSNVLSFNNLCNFHALDANPLKEAMNGTLWKRLPVLRKSKSLPEDMLLYAACDVYPLLDLYDATRKQIEPDFLPLMEDLCEDELLRPIDKKLVQARQKARRRVEEATLCLNNLDAGAKKADVYALLTRHDGRRKVLFSKSGRSAHVILSSRDSAICALHNLTAKNFTFPSEFGDGPLGVKLVRSLNTEEAVLTQSDINSFRERSAMESCIVDVKVSAKIVRAIITAKVPVVLFFHTRAEGVTMDLFAGGSYPILKLSLMPDIVIEGGVAELFSSSHVEKIVFKIDNCYAALRACSVENYRPSNFFDVSLAHKAADYLRYGQSIFRSKMDTINDVFEEHGLARDGHVDKLESLRFLHAHFKRTLPKELLELVAQKSQVDVDILAQVKNSTKSKSERKALKSKYDMHAVHVRVEGGPNKRRLRPVLSNYLRSRKIPHKWICDGDNVAMIEVVFNPDVALVVDDLQSKAVEDLTLSASAVANNSSVEKPVETVVIPLNELRQDMHTDVERLTREGFFETLKEEGESIIESKSPL